MFRRRDSIVVATDAAAVATAAAQLPDQNVAAQADVVAIEP
jgi:hypothetical protein